MGIPAVQSQPLSDFSLLQMDVPAIDALLKVLAGDFDLTQLDKIAIEEQSLSWVIPSLHGEIMVSALDVIIIAVRPTRAYWQTAYQRGQSGSPPDCASDTGQWGSGNPGGECAYCPLNQFGSDPRGRGKACREYRELFVMDQEDIFPKLLRVPRTSLVPVTGYLFALAKHKLTEQIGNQTVQRPLIPSDVLTRLTLVQGHGFSR